MAGTHDGLGSQGVIECYGLDALVRPGEFPRPMPLGTALEAERELCPERGEGVDAERARYLVKILAAGGTQILPEHLSLLAQAE